jgi:iron complex transport system ATP-binding protein
MGICGHRTILYIEEVNTNKLPAAGQQQGANAPGANAIEMRGVGVMRDGRWILRDVDWRVGNGSLAAILGPNGSGKSTLARIAACHLWPTAGQCSVLGGRFGQANLPELRRRIRLVQAAGPYDVDPALTAREVVLTGYFGSIGLYETPDAQMTRQAEQLLELLGLSAVVDHSYASLSSGERMRSLIARAMVTRPGLLILDEPTSGLDPLAREQVLATIETLLETGGGPTVVLITHHIEELPPRTSQVLLLQDGRPAASGAMEAVLRSQILSRTFGFPVQVRASGGRYYLEVHPTAWKGLLPDRKV